MALRVATSVASRAVLATRPNRILPAAAISITGNAVSSRGYAMDLELTNHGILWRRPAYVASWRPEKSGDLHPSQPPDLNQPRLDVKPAAEYLDQVDEVTRQLTSLKFSNKRERRRVEELRVLRRVQRHQQDTQSLEVCVARMTVSIRNLQEGMDQTKKYKLRRIKLQETIDKRKKLLKSLQAKDYKRFEWLIEELGIIYRPHPNKYRWVTRKESLQKLVQLYGEDLRKKRMDEYKAILEEQKVPFQKEKAETLRWIAETEASIGVPVSVTVLEETQEKVQEETVKS